MITLKDDAAFASDTSTEGGTYGLTKREYFAVQILSGMLGNSRYATEVGKSLDAAAFVAVAVADELIEQLRK